MKDKRSTRFTWKQYFFVDILYTWVEIRNQNSVIS